MGQKGFDTRFWKYKYSWVDKSKSGQKANRFDPETGTYREGFSRQGLVKEAEVYVYPDTLTWLHDFSYTFNEPMFDTYFWHPAYGEYPVVGVNWEQAKAFCNWRTDYRLSLLTPYQRNMKQNTVFLQKSSGNMLLEVIKIIQFIRGVVHILATVKVVF